MDESPSNTSNCNWPGFIRLLAGKGLVPYTGDVIFHEIEGAEKPFAPYYEKLIRPRLAVFESRRIEALRALRQRSFTVIPICVLLLSVMIIGVVRFFGSEHESFSVTTLSMMGIPSGIIIFAIWWASRPAMVYKSDVKSEIYPHIFRYFGDDFIYQEQGSLSAATLDDSGIIPSYDFEHREDYVRGKWKGVELELTESTLTKKRGKDNDRYETVFKGMFVRLSMNKQFSGKTIVKKDAGKVVNWFEDKFNKLEAVCLEDPEFESRFAVYSADQVEARYLLTPSFMVRLINLSELLSAGVQCSFYNDTLLIMLETNVDRFETSSIFMPATFVEEINTILDEMPVIFDIIDIIKLDQRTGL